MIGAELHELAEVLISTCEHGVIMTPARMFLQGDCSLWSWLIGDWLRVSAVYIISETKVNPM